MSPTCRTRKTRPQVSTSPHPEHQNVPLWARSGVPSSPPSFRTPESAHMSHTSPLPISNTRTCPHGHVLVLMHLPSPSPSSQTPERAHVWLVLVLAHLRSSFLSSRASERAHTGSF